MISRPDVAQSLVQSYLPPEQVAGLDLDSLRLEKDSFEDSDLSEHLSDMVYEVKLRSGEPGYVYMLLSPDLGQRVPGILRLMEKVVASRGGLEA